MRYSPLFFLSTKQAYVTFDIYKYHILPSKEDRFTQAYLTLYITLFAQHKHYLLTHFVFHTHFPYIC